MSLDWTGDGIGDRAMSTTCTKALPKVKDLHDSAHVPEMPLAEEAFHNVDNVSQSSTDEGTDVELIDEDGFIRARHENNAAAPRVCPQLLLDETIKKD